MFAIAAHKEVIPLNECVFTALGIGKPLAWYAVCIMHTIHRAIVLLEGA